MSQEHPTGKPLSSGRGAVTIRDLEVLRTILVVALIVAFCGWLVMGVGR